MGDLFAEAERHGLSGVLRGAFLGRGVEIPADLAEALELRETARGADHQGHLAILERIDAAFAAEGVAAVGLKGPLFAERFYDTPSSRATTDIDLLVDPAELDRASAALGSIGYRAEGGPDEERFRREHHHLHFRHPEAPFLELHFHGYRGFGRVLPSPPLLARRQPSPLAGARTPTDRAPEDELVFLSVHAAVHRFVRLGWLYDILLLVRTMGPAQLEVSAARARDWGYARVTAFAVMLLVELFDLPRGVLEPLAEVGAVRGRVARLLLGEPRSGALRSATRFAYTAALCDEGGAAVRYAVGASRGHARRVLGRTA
jgi:hypothetical protein